MQPAENDPKSALLNVCPSLVDDVEVKIRQYSYIRIFSQNLAADDLEARIGVKADELVFAGSRPEHGGPPRKVNSWRLICDETGLGAEQQIARLLSRIESARSAIRDLVAESDAEVVLQVVRYFNDDQGEEEEFPIREDGLQKLPGQHQLLGWHVDKSVIDFLVEMNAELDCDEYDWAELPFESELFGS